MPLKWAVSSVTDVNIVSQQPASQHWPGCLQMSLQPIFVYRPCEHKRRPMPIISKCQMWSQIISQWSHWSITSIHISTEDDIIIMLLDIYETATPYLVAKSFWARLWHNVDQSRVLLLASKEEQSKWWLYVAGKVQMDIQAYRWQGKGLDVKQLKGPSASLIKPVLFGRLNHLSNMF